MSFDTIRTEIRGTTGLITLDRPDALNALNNQVCIELVDCLRELDGSDKVDCAIITGSEKAFAAGADIKEMADLNFIDVFLSNQFEHLPKVAAFRKPLIAAVSGYALGGGCELAMMCDFIIASDTAKFGQPEISLGIIPGWGGSQRLARSIGKSKAMDMVLTGRMMDAEEAERCGLVSRVVPTAKLLDEAFAAAESIASYSRPATMMAKEAVNRAYEVGQEEGLRFERQLFSSLFATEDQKEGMAAFAEKRTAQFKNQ